MTKREAAKQITPSDANRIMMEPVSPVTMIERWLLEWIMRFPSSKFRMLKDLQFFSAAEIEAMLTLRVVIVNNAANMKRLRCVRGLPTLNGEMDKWFKAQ